LTKIRLNQGELELENGSRIVALPGREGTIRSFSGVNLLVIDEAARVPDDLYRSVRPMLAVSGGRLAALSTPFGKRGWFYEEWVGTGPWRRFEIPWQQCPRIAPAFIHDEERALGLAWVDQEYGCRFTALEGLVYPDFAQACVPEQPVPAGQAVGGIDFGWRSPFAAVWGVLDRDDVLWITHEYYVREKSTKEHAEALPKNVLWLADPSDPQEIRDLQHSGLKIKKGPNEVRRGIAAVNTRIRTGRLKVFPRCKNLIAEAGLYRYPTAGERMREDENPIDDHNHALAALRYLVLWLGFRDRRIPEAEPAPPPKKDPWDDEQGWVELG
jgi:hypothetical protein